MVLTLPKPGDILTSEQLVQLFQCSSQGGMRRSLKTNTLVIVSKQFDKQYEDRWQGDILHYTGMGLKGPQDLNRSQNKILNRHQELGVSVHLFEQFRVGEYHYQGEAYLSGSPYQETQPDTDGKDRSVWMFPLKLLEGEPIPEAQEKYKERYEKRERKATGLSDQELRKRAGEARKKSGRKKVATYQHERDENVAAYAKRRAAGVCDLCEIVAPFVKNDGTPYLECHHIVWLANGGEDTIANTVALCPNCHR